MKFRTDFVTNSSDSSFLAFNIKNKKLFDYLNKLGIKIEGTDNGDFSDGMRIVLPSGESAVIGGEENWSYPFVWEYNSISAWVVAMLLWEVENQYPQKKEDEYSNFAKELIRILNDADILKLDWELVEEWSRDMMHPDLSSAFDEMDGEIEAANIEHVYGFEGKVGPCIYVEVQKGKKMCVEYSNEDEVETEECDGVTFVVSGKLKVFENRDAIVEYIEDLGGRVSDSISQNTDYLICNDLHSNSLKMKHAKDLGIPVLTETGLIRRFGDISDFEDIPGEEELGDEIWDMTFGGGVLNTVIENGLIPTVMEVWKDGHWTSK